MNEEEYDNPFVECEICDTMVRFNDYNSHVQECGRYRTMPMQLGDMFSPFFVSPREQPLLEDADENENENEDENEENDENDENDGFPFINTSTNSLFQFPLAPLNIPFPNNANYTMSNVNTNNRFAEMILRELIQSSQQLANPNDSAPAQPEMVQYTINLDFTVPPPDEESSTQNVEREQTLNQIANNIVNGTLSVDSIDEQMDFIQGRLDGNPLSESDVEERTMMINRITQLIQNHNQRTFANISNLLSQTIVPSSIESGQGQRIQYTSSELQSMEGNIETGVINSYDPIVPAPSLPVLNPFSQPFSLQNIPFTSLFGPPQIVDEYEYNLFLANRMGRVEKGIDNIDEVSTIITECPDDELCAICQETIKDVKENNVTIRKLSCKHIFCEPCIQTWFQKNVKCPVCQIDLDENKNIHNQESSL